MHLYEYPVNLYISKSYDDAETAQNFIKALAGEQLTVSKSRNGDYLYVSIEGSGEDIDAFLDVYKDKFTDIVWDCDADANGWVKPKDVYDSIGQDGKVLPEESKVGEGRSNEDYLQEVWDSLAVVWDKDKFNMGKGYDSEYECECITITSKDNEEVRAKIYVEDYNGSHPAAFNVVYRYPGDKGVGVMGTYEFQSTDMDGLGEEVFDYFDEIKQKVGESKKSEDFDMNKAFFQAKKAITDWTTNQKHKTLEWLYTDGRKSPTSYPSGIWDFEWDTGDGMATAELKVSPYETRANSWNDSLDFALKSGPEGKYMYYTSAEDVLYALDKLIRDTEFNGESKKSESDKTSWALEYLVKIAKEKGLKVSWEDANEICITVGTFPHQDHIFVTDDALGKVDTSLELYVPAAHINTSGLTLQDVLDYLDDPIGKRDAVQFKNGNRSGKVESKKSDKDCKGKGCDNSDEKCGGDKKKENRGKPQEGPGAGYDVSFEDVDVKDVSVTFNEAKDAFDVSLKISARMNAEGYDWDTQYYRERMGYEPEDDEITLKFSLPNSSFKQDWADMGMANASIEEKVKALDEAFHSVDLKKFGYGGGYSHSKFNPGSVNRVLVYPFEYDGAYVEPCQSNSSLLEYNTYIPLEMDVQGTFAQDVEGAWNYDSDLYDYTEKVRDIVVKDLLPEQEISNSDISDDRCEDYFTGGWDAEDAANEIADELRDSSESNKSESLSLKQKELNKTKFVVGMMISLDGVKQYIRELKSRTFVGQSVDTGKEFSLPISSLNRASILYDPRNESKKSESLTLKQKELKDMARYGEAVDITTISDAEAKELKKKGIETVGISRGVYGMNGALLRDSEGNKYVITARSSNLFYFV